MGSTTANQTILQSARNLGASKTRCIRHLERRSTR